MTLAQESPFPVDNTSQNNESYTVALAGNPNVGKSTIFNALTGENQHVGNWPGKTVEKKEGHLQLGGHQVVLVDLPGTYSLSAYSVEEIVSRDFLVSEHPAVVVAVVDASNLERNLYLVTQIIELNVPLLLVLNMADVARGRGILLDKARLSANLNGVPIIETIGTDGAGLDTLRQTLQHALERQQNSTNTIRYTPHLEKAVADLMPTLEAHPEALAHYPARWVALKLLEEDEDILQRLEHHGYAGLLRRAAEVRADVAIATGEDAETLISDGRYGFIQNVLRDAVRRTHDDNLTSSDKIDRVLTHRWLGAPIFLVLMWLMFQVTANVSAPMLDWVDGVIAEPITRWLMALISIIGLSGTWVESLLVDGVVAGVGGVLVFVPVLMSLYVVLGALEDSGYMARATFVMDRAMRALGLHGKSFIPMMVGFGCTVPAVYATRTLENETDRKITGFLLTFMSCGARLPVYVVIGAAFFGAGSGNLIFALYLVGIVVALLTGFALRHTVYKNNPPPPFVMELPPYRFPRARYIIGQMWERTSDFIQGATTVILVTSVVLWFLMAIPMRDGAFNDVALEDSLFGSVAQTISPVFAPAGFGEWEATGSLVTGFVAKEVVIGTMSQIYLGVAEENAVDNTVEAEVVEEVPTFIEDLGFIASSFGEATLLTVQETINIIPRTVNLVPAIEMGEADFLGVDGEEDDTTALESALTSHFTPLTALAFMVFVLLYTPCMATVGAMRAEFGTRWTIYQVLYTLGIAWLGAVLVFQIGTLLGFGV
jgi:ferrous iron transport protein B